MLQLLPTVTLLHMHMPGERVPVPVPVPVPVSVLVRACVPCTAVCVEAPSELAAPEQGTPFVQRPDTADSTLASRHAGSFRATADVRADSSASER